MNSSKSIYLYYAILAASIVFLHPIEAQNLLVNPGMEDSGSGFPGWREEFFARGVTDFAIETSRPHGGRNCASIVNKDPNDARLIQTVTVKENSNYKIAGCIRTDKVGDEGAGASLSIENYWVGSKGVKGTTSGWTYTEYYITVKQAITALDFSLRLGGTSAMSSGTALFDDILIEEVGTIPGGYLSYVISEDAMMNKPQKVTAAQTVVVQPQPAAPRSWMQFIILFATLGAAVAVYCVLLFVKPK
jgi:hypothetical protein